MFHKMFLMGLEKFKVPLLCFFMQCVIQLFANVKGLQSFKDQSA